MLYEQLKKNPNLILRNTVKHNFVLYKVSIEELKEIQSDLDLNEDGEVILENIKKDKCDFLDRMYGGGDIAETTVHFCQAIIPIENSFIIKSTNALGKGSVIDEYRCYIFNCKHNTIIHEDKLSSFRCACEKIKAKYFVVLKEEINNVKD